MRWLGVVAVILATAAHWINPSVRSIAGLSIPAFDVRPVALCVNLLHSLGLLVAAGGMLGACTATGRIMTTWIGGRPQAGGAVALGAGLLAGSLAVMGIGLTGLMSRPVIGAALFAGIVLAVRGRLWRILIRAWRGAPPGSLRPGWLLLPAVPSLLGAPLLSVTDVDMMEYHVGLPVLWLMQHRIHYEPGHLLMTMPLGMERLLVPLQAFGLGGGMVWFDLALVAVAGRAVADVLGRCGIAGAAWGGWLVIGWGAALHLGAAGHPDTALVLASALGCRAIAMGSGRDLGLACALAASVKYQGMALAAAFAVSGVPWRGHLRHVAGYCGRVGLLSVLPNLPWLLRNGWLTGNPVYPFASGFLPSLGWTAWNSAVLWGSMRNASIELAWLFPSEAVGAFAGAFWTGTGSGWFSAYTALVYLLVPVWVMRSPGPVRRIAAAGVLFALVWLLPMPKFGRYLAPGLVPALIAWWVCVASLPAVVGRSAACVIILVQSLTVPAAWSGGAVSPAGVLTGVGSVEAAARSSLGIWVEVTRWINEHPVPGRTLVIGHGYGMGLDRPWRSANETGRPAWMSAAGERPDGIRMRIGLRQAGVTRVLYNPVRAFHRSNYWSGYGFAGDDWIRAWADVWRRWGVVDRPPREADWTGAWFVWSMSVKPHPPVAPPWVPGIEWIFSSEFDLAAGRHDPVALSRQRRLLPDVAASRFQAGIAAARASRTAALREVGAAVAGGVGLPGAWRVYAELLEGAGRRAEAAAALRAALLIEPGHPGARDALARLDPHRPR